MTDEVYCYCTIKLACAVQSIEEGRFLPKIKVTQLDAENAKVARKMLNDSKHTLFSKNTYGIKALNLTERESCASFRP